MLIMEILNLIGVQSWAYLRKTTQEDAWREKMPLRHQSSIFPLFRSAVFRAAAQITKPLEAANFVPIQNIDWPLCFVPAWFSLQGTKP